MEPEEIEDYLFNPDTPAIAKEMNCGASFETINDMKKFNKWEAWLLEKGLELAKKEMLAEIKQAKKDGKHHIFHPNFVNMTVEEIQGKLKENTKKR